MLKNWWSIIWILVGGFHVISMTQREPWELPSNLYISSGWAPFHISFSRIYSVFLGTSFATFDLMMKMVLGSHCDHRYHEKRLVFFFHRVSNDVPHGGIKPWFFSWLFIKNRMPIIIPKESCQKNMNFKALFEQFLTTGLIVTLRQHRWALARFLAVKPGRWNNLTELRCMNIWKLQESMGYCNLGWGDYILTGIGLPGTSQHRWSLPLIIFSSTLDPN